MTTVHVPHPILSRYGASEAANSAIARLLGEHLPLRTPGGVHIGDCYADAVDVTLHYSHSCRHTFLPLGLFAPYFSTMRPEDLARLVCGSLDDDRHMGRTSFGLDREESAFLADHAIPTILDAKIALAQRTRSADIRFGIKILGMGRELLEFHQVVRLVRDALQRRRDFTGLCDFHCLGFDVSVNLLNNGGSYACSDGTIEAYYADLTDPVSAPVAMTHGTPDIVCWRNTHVLRRQSMNRWLGERMVDAIRETVALPGALLVHEASRNGRLIVQELVEWRDNGVARQP